MHVPTGFLGSLIGAAAVLVWRLRESTSPVSTKKIVVPPLGMATGFCMFLAPAFRVPLAWGLGAFFVGALALAYPLLRTTRLIREGDDVMMQRSAAFIGVILGLAAIRLLARSYFDRILSAEQTAALFFVLAFGMIVRWRVQMFLDYRRIRAT